MLGAADLLSDSSSERPSDTMASKRAGCDAGPEEECCDTPMPCRPLDSMREQAWCCIFAT